MDDYVSRTKPCILYVGNVSLNSPLFTSLCTDSRSSTHNTRIERLWLESGRHFARGWRAFFTRLERLHFLERDNPQHIWLLHTLFLEDIQLDCDEFCQSWNSHPLSGKGENMSPLVCACDPRFSSFIYNAIDQDIRLLGQTQHGVYDEADGVDPAILHRYYGAAMAKDSEDSDYVHDVASSVGSSTSSSASTGVYSRSDGDPSDVSDTGSSSDSEGDPDSASDDLPDDEGSGSGGEEVEGAHTLTWQEIAATIANAQKRNIRHAAAEVAALAIPFENTDELRAYTLALDASLSSCEFPAGFGLNEVYESVESYKTGRSSKSLIIPLPYEVWFPRITVWCKALDLLKRLSICRETTV